MSRKNYAFKLVLEWLSHPAFRLAAVGAVGIAAAGVWWLARSGVGWTEVKEFAAAGIDFLGKNPLLLFAAIATLPVLPVPVSALLLLAGVVYVPIMGVPLACALTLGAMILNALLGYWIAAKPGRGMVMRMLRHVEFEIPRLKEGDQWKLALILRVTPGMPYFLQNLVQGFLHVPMRIFLPVSIVVVGFSTCAFIITGGALFSGRIGMVILGVSLVVAVAAGASFLRGYLAKNGKGK